MAIVTTRHFGTVAAIALGVLLAFASRPAAAAPMIETGRQLRAACAAYLQKTTRETENIMAAHDACKEYLSGFIAAYGVSQQVDLTLELEGTGSEPDAALCFRLPTYLSFSDFARLVVDFGQGHREFESKPAFQLAAASLVAKYPCRQFRVQGMPARKH